MPMPIEPQSLELSKPPTHVRWRVVSLLAVMAGLTYVDRLNLGIAGRSIEQEFKFDTQTMGWILGAFSLGYAIFHIAGGWLADRFGPRRILSLAILWFSFFTAATAFAPSLPGLRMLGAAWSFAILRFVMGLGEAAALPVGNKMMAYWLGPKERAFGTSVFLAGVGAGGIMAPIVIGMMTRHWGWRASFVGAGIIGILVAIACYTQITDRPEEHSGVNAAELALIRGERKPETDPAKQIKKVPWFKLFSSPSVWGLMVGHFCLVYPVYIFFTWFFIYLVKVRGITITKASFWSSAPFVANLIVVPIWGWLSDRAAERLGKRHGRRATAWLGIGCSAALLCFGTHTSNNTWALLELAGAAGFNFAASAVLWTTCNDISAEYSGSISGIMTTFGSLGGWLSPVLTALIARKFGWIHALDFAALVTLTSGLAWLVIDADRVIRDEGIPALEAHSSD